MDDLKEKSEEAEKALTPEEKRFLLDLEFVQCLANPSYLQCTFGISPSLSDSPSLWISSDFAFVDLAAHDAKYFSDDRFVNYLKYLTYFKDPKYSRYLQYVILLILFYL